MKTTPPQRNDAGSNLQARLEPAWSRILTGGRLGLFCLLGLTATAVAQTRTNVYFTPYSTRVSVPVGLFTNSTVISNQIRLVNFDTNPPLARVYFDVSGLPAGAGYTLTDTNGNALLSTTQGTNLMLTVNTTNIAQGEYVFTLNASVTNDAGVVAVTNSIPYVLQAGYIWNGAGFGVFGVSNNWASTGSWVGGVVPGASDDALIGDSGAQTNLFAIGYSFTNITVSADTTVGSIRFMQSVFTNAVTTNTLYHTINILPGKTLSVTGPRGFQLLRDYLDENAFLPRTLGVSIRGGGGAKLVVSNETANIGFLIDNQSAAGTPFLNLSNLDNFVTDVSRIGVGEYQLYPNYRAYNNGNHDTNYFTANYTGTPRRFTANIFLARTNNIKAVYADPDNYTNETTRGYGLSFLDSESAGATPNTFFFLGASNSFFADSVCFVRANHTMGNGTLQFGTNNGVAVFRGTNGGRMSVFTVSDGGGTNAAQGNIKAAINFNLVAGQVDILADRLYLSRDRTIITSNQTPNIQADLTIGKGIVDVNNAILGFQEHDGKIDWTTIGNAAAYLNYCQGRLFVTNGGTFRVNGTLTLGYTADSNPVGSAQQFNTYGQITVSSNSTVAANTIIEDGGSNWYLSPSLRQNRILLLSGSTLIVSNTLGAPPGLPLDTLSLTAATNVLFVDTTRTNLYVRNLVTSGVIPSTLKIASLAGVTGYPAQVALVSYSGAYTAPSLVADVTALGASFHAYIVNNSANRTIDMVVTTNTANSLVWSGGATSSWNTTNSPDWIGPTNVFGVGDFVRFDDTSANTNVTVVDLVIPGQSSGTPGMTISNSAEAYLFTSGTIGGAGTILKQGTNNVQMDSGAQGAITITAGSVTGSGGLGAVTMFTNTSLTFSGAIVGGLTSTGTVVISSGSPLSVFGPVTIGGGSFANSGNVDTSASGVMTVTGGSAATNTGTISISGGSVNSAGFLDAGCTFTLFAPGVVNNNLGSFAVSGTLVGNGTFFDPQSTATFANSPPGRVVLNGGGVLAPGGPGNTIGTMTIDSRFDLNETAGNPGVLVIKVDWSNPQVNDQLSLDRWNNMYGMLLMTNVNPAAGGYTNGQTYLIAKNNNVIGGGFVQDIPFSQPMMWPPIPAPGLAWQLDGIRSNGIVAITNQLVWRGNASGDWNTNDADWAGPATVYADGYGVLFDDSATGATNINVAMLVQPATNPNDTNNMIVSPGIMVSNSLLQYTFSGTNSIGGRANLYKTGPGTLTILGTNNTYSGNTTIDGGTLSVQALASWSAACSIGRGSFSTTNYVQKNTSSTSAGNQIPLTIANGAKFQYIGTSNTALDRPILLQPGGGVIDVSTNFTVLTESGAFNGVGSLTKAGAGTLLLTSAANTYSGGTIVSAGRLILNATAPGTGGVSVNGAGATLELTNALTLTNAVSVSSSGTVMISSNIIVTGPWSGTGTVMITNQGLFTISTSLSNFSGAFTAATISSNGFVFNRRTNDNFCLGSATSSFDLGPGSAKLNNFNGAGLIYDLGSLAGGVNTALSGRSSNTVVWPAASTYRIGALGTSTIFAGTISNGADTVSIIKVGGGALTVSGNNTYSGGTTVSNGTLLVSNAAGSGTGSGAVTVVSGATLGGSGSISGTVTIQAGATVSPGASIGTLTMTNTVTILGTALMELNRANSPATNDMIVGNNLVVNAGTLLVTNVGPNLHNGDKFKLFSGAVNFGVFTLPPKDPSGTSTYVWNNNLAVDGTIQLVTGGVVNTSPTSITTTVSGKTLTLGWPSDHIGWQLQSNSVGLLSTNMWFPVSGSTATNLESFPEDLTQLNVFFRLVYPPVP